MKYLIFIMVAGFFDSVGQHELIIDIPIDSMQLLRTKEEIGRKNFKLLSRNYGRVFEYENFVNPGQSFNTTDIQSPPGNRLILGIRAKEFLIILYEFGSYYGPLTSCVVVVSGKKKIDMFTATSKIETEDDLLGLLKQGKLKVEKNRKGR